MEKEGPQVMNMGSSVVHMKRGGPRALELLKAVWHNQDGGIVNVVGYRCAVQSPEPRLPTSMSRAPGLASTE